MWMDVETRESARQPRRAPLRPFMMEIPSRSEIAKSESQAKSFSSLRVVRRDEF